MILDRAGLKRCVDCVLTQLPSILEASERYGVTMIWRGHSFQEPESRDSMLTKDRA